MKSTNTANTEKKVAEILFDIGSIIFRPKQPFKYNTGIISPVYTDNRLLISRPRERNIIVNLMLAKIKEIGIPDVLAGTATAGIPHAAFLAQKLNLPMIYVKGQAKEYGKHSQVEGTLKRGQKVVVIEDLVSTGGSSVRVVEAVRELGAKASDVIAIFTYRLKEAEDNFKKANVRLHCLTNLDEACKIAVKKGFLKQDQVKIILDWAKDPKNWKPPSL